MIMNNIRKILDIVRVTVMILYTMASLCLCVIFINHGNVLDWKYVLLWICDTTSFIYLLKVVIVIASSAEGEMAMDGSEDKGEGEVNRKNFAAFVNRPSLRPTLFYLVLGTNLLVIKAFILLVSYSSSGNFVWMIMRSTSALLLSSSSSSSLENYKKGSLVTIFWFVVFLNIVSSFCGYKVVMIHSAQLEQKRSKMEDQLFEEKLKV